MEKKEYITFLRIVSQYEYDNHHTKQLTDMPRYGYSDLKKGIVHHMRSKFSQFRGNDIKKDEYKDCISGFLMPQDLFSYYEKIKKKENTPEFPYIKAKDGTMATFVGLIKVEAELKNHVRYFSKKFNTYQLATLEQYEDICEVEPQGQIDNEVCEFLLPTSKFISEDTCQPADIANKNYNAYVLYKRKELIPEVYENIFTYSDFIEIGEFKNSFNEVFKEKNLPLIP